jgi:nucleoside-diphosphate-sugar epimerase
MTTLITGAGLVGTAYALVAAQRGERSVFLDPIPREDYLAERMGDIDHGVVREDVRSLPGLVEAIREHDADTVVHTAGLIGRRVENPLHTGFDLLIGGVMTVAEAVRITGVKRLVHLSTFGAYDWRRDLPDKIDETCPTGGGSGYSNGKAAQELLLEIYQAKYGFELAVLRPGNVFGVGHFWGGSGGGEKVQALLEAGIKGETARIPEAQTMNFEYLYSKDMGRALDLAATADLPDRAVYNIAYGRSITFDELVETARKFFPGLEVEIIPGTPPVSRTQSLDVSRAERELGWTPEYTLEQGFGDYIEDLRTYLARDDR